MIKREHSATIIPDAPGSHIIGLWLSIKQPCWRRSPGVANLTLGHAQRLIKAYKLKMGMAIPQSILGAGLPSPIISAMECLLTKGQWEPTILPFNDGPTPGFERFEKFYGRMILMHHIPGEKADTAEFRVAHEAYPAGPNETLDTCNSIFSPFLFKTKRGRPGSPIEIARELKKRFDAADLAGRQVRSPYGTIVKGVWKRRKGMSFKQEYDGYAEKIKEGTVINRELLTNPESCMDHRDWLGNEHKTIHVLNMEKVYPRINIRYEDFPVEVREHDRDFFDVPW